MKKIVLFIFSILLFFMCNFSNVCAEEKKDNFNDLLKNNTIENFYKEIEENSSEESILKSLNPREFIKQYSKDGKSSITAGNVINFISKNLFKELYVCIKIMITIIVIAVISALLKNIEDAFTGSGIADIAFYSCYVLIILLITKNFVSSIGIAKDAIKEITDFMAAIMPVLILLITTAGGITQGATLDPIVAAAVNITPKIYMDIILPLILMSFVLCFVNNISTDHKVDQLAKFIKQITLWLQGIMLTIFVGLISIRSMTSSTLDAVTLKTAKFAVDNFIPIVGKAISDSISTVAGYALLLKNAFGVLGLIIILIVLIIPVIKIFSIVIVYKISAAVIEPIVDKRIVNCISSAADSLVLVSSMLFCVSLIFFVLLCIMANTGKLIIGG